MPSTCLPLQIIQIHARLCSHCVEVCPSTANASGRCHFAYGFGVSWPVSVVIDAHMSIVIDIFFGMATLLRLAGGELRIWSRTLLRRALWTLSHIAMQMSNYDLFAFIHT
jgi:hypothetical protein